MAFCTVWEKLPVNRNIWSTVKDNRLTVQNFHFPKCQAWLRSSEMATEKAPQRGTTSFCSIAAAAIAILLLNSSLNICLSSIYVFLRGMGVLCLVQTLEVLVLSYDDTYREQLLAPQNLNLYILRQREWKNES